MKSIKRRCVGHLRRILIFQSIKVALFTLANSGCKLLAVYTQHRTHKQLVFMEIFQCSQRSDRGKPSRRVYFASNWWFRRVTDILTCSKRAWRKGADDCLRCTLLERGELNLIMFS